MLADLEYLHAKEVRSIPLTYWELEKTLGMFGNLLGVILGNQHVLTRTYCDLWVLLSSGLRDDFILYWSIKDMSNLLTFFAVSS
jgi:hypothetical protein